MSCIKADLTYKPLIKDLVQCTVSTSLSRVEAEHCPRRSARTVCSTIHARSRARAQMSVEFNDIDNDDEEEADDLETGISWLSCRILTCSNGTVRIQAAIFNYIIGPLHFFVGYLCHLDTPRIVLNAYEVQKCIHAACECLLESWPV